MARTIAFALILLTSVAAPSPALGAPQLDLQAVPAPSSYLGVGIIEVSQEAAREIGLLDPHGVEISSVADTSPAEEAGLQAGDIVLTYRDERVNGIQHFARLVRETPAGGRVELGVVRDRARLTVDVQIGERAAEAGVRKTIESVKERIERDRDRMAEVRKRLDSVRMKLMADGWDWCEDCPKSFRDLDLKFDLNVPSLRFSLGVRWLGADLEELEGQLAEFFGVEAGVLVRQVLGGSPADRAGLRAGDVIVAVDGKPVSRPEAIDEAASATSGDAAVRVEVVRDRKPVSLVIGAGGRKGPRKAKPVSFSN